MPKISGTVRSKWFHHVGTFKVVRLANGETRLRGPHSHASYCIGDRHVQDVFVWLGRYLASKGKLPRHVTLDELAVKSTSVGRGIRQVIATEHYASLSSKVPDKDGR